MTPSSSTLAAAGAAATIGPALLGVEAGAAEAELAQRIGLCRTLAASGRPAFCLQSFDLGRLRARSGARWEALRPRAVALLRSGLLAELGPADLLVDDGAERLFLVRATADRREAERHAALLAAAVTGRLCGTLPGGAIVAVDTLSFEPATALADVATRLDLVACLTQACEPHGPDVRGWTESTGLRPRFEPVVHLRKRLVSAYRLTPMIGDVPFATADVGAQAELDRWCLERASPLIHAAHARGEAGLIVPLHYATVAGLRFRDRLVRACRHLPRRAHRQLVIELIGLPPELPQARVRELVAYLRPFCLALVVRIEHPCPSLAHLDGAGVQGVTCAGDWATGDPPGSALGELAGRARVSGLRTGLTGVVTPRLCRLAVAAGIDQISGTGILPALERPGRAFRLA